MSVEDIVIVTEKMPCFSVTMAEKCPIPNKTANVTEKYCIFSVTLHQVAGLLYRTDLRQQRLDDGSQLVVFQKETVVSELGCDFVIYRLWNA